MRAALPLSLALWLMAGPVMAQTIPDPLTPYVSDFADLIPPEAEARLTDTLRDLRREQGIEVAVVTDDSPLGGRYPTLESYATALFNQWGIGDKNRHDGVLLLLLAGDRSARIELGAGYDPVWDNRAQRVMETLMVPRFAQGDYAGGLEAGLHGVREYIVIPFASGTRAEDAPDVPEVWGGLNWLDTIMVGGFVLLGGGILAQRLRRRIKDEMVRRRPCPNCGTIGVTLNRLTRDLDDNRRERIVTHMCPHCGWSQSRNEVIQTRDESDSDGFGGGQSSGGGASGRW